MPSEREHEMATTGARSGLSRQDGRAVLTARGLHAVVDSPPPLGGPNEAMNPVDLLLGALATCGTFVCETAARELGLPLEDATVEVEADFDPRGVKGEEGVSPAMQVFRVTLRLTGVDDEAGAELAGHFRRRCPVFTTLEQAAPIELDVVIE